MSYTKSVQYPGWIHDEVLDDYISPKGRTAPYPGAAFTGMLSATELASIKELAEEPVIEKESREEVANNAPTVEVVHTITFGDVTVNFIRVY